MKKRCLNGVRYYVLIIFIGIVFFFGLGDQSPIMMSDSITYLDPTSNISAGYIIYPVFVRYVSMLFGEMRGLKVIVLLQSLLAFLTSVYVTNIIRRIYDLTYLQAICVFGLSLLQYAYSLPEHVLTHEIMTEALAVPLVNLIMVLLIRFFSFQQKRDILFSLILGVILVFVRPQLLTIFMALLVVLFIWILWHWYLGMKKEKELYVIGCFGVLFVACILIVKPITVQSINIFAQLSQAITGKVICVIQKDDRELFANTEQGMFDYVYEQIDKNQNLVSYFSNGVKRGDDIMTAINENSKDFFDLTRIYYQENYQQYHVEDFFITAPKMRNNIISALLEKRFGDVIVLTLQLLPSSFVSAIFIQPDNIKVFCYIIAFMLYLLSIVEILFARKRNIESIYFYPIEITYIMLVANVLLTNFIFYGQQRYVTYSFGWFYISLFILSCGWKRKKIILKDGMDI